jgi:uncharacterized protein (TIGR02001 family)
MRGTWGAFKASVILGGLAMVGWTAAAGAADLSVRRELPPEAAPPAASVPADLLFSVRLQSDYVFRGISQSNRQPSLQSSFELQFLDNLFYAGLAAYKVDLVTRPTMEQDWTIGIRPKFGPLQFDFGLIYYNYPSERRFVDPFTNTIWSPANTDMLELAGKVSYTYQDALTLGANVFHAQNWLGTRAPGTYGSLTAKYAIPETLLGVSGLAVSGELGRYWLGTTSATLGSVGLPDYTYWNAGLSYTWKVLTFDLRYHATDLSKRDCFTLTSDPRGILTGSGRSRWCGSTVVGTVSVDLQASTLPGIFAPK